MRSVELREKRKKHQEEMEVVVHTLVQCLYFIFLRVKS